MTAPSRSLPSQAGFGPRSRKPSFLILGDSQGAFEAIAPVLECLTRSDQRVGCFLSAADAGLRRWLEERFPDFTAVRPALGLGPVGGAFLRRLKVRTVILLEREAVLGPGEAANLRKRAIPLVLLSGRGAAKLEPETESGYAPELLVATDRGDENATRGDSRLRLFQSESGQMDGASATKVLDLLMPLAGRNLKWANRGDRPVRRWIGQRLFRALERPYLAARLRPYVQRIDSLAALNDRLGTPGTILCLGNGPSSEDSGLQDVAYDALFRVNHSWKERGLHANPEVVFTGNQNTMRVVKSAILGLQDEIGEKAMLMTRGPGMLRDPVRYFVINRLGRFLTGFDWGEHRPTNGAAMIALAVALKPQRLVIAGVDLFQHPEGSYPGDKRTPNAYTPAHTLDKELAFMLFHLEQFDGDVVIFGEALERIWRQHRAASDCRSLGPSAL